jgi:nucleotide-binding universal stress UspA family protein
MGSVLIVLRNDEPDEELLAAANQYVMGTEESIVICRFVDEAQYQSDVQQNARSGNEMDDIESIENAAANTATSIAESEFDGSVLKTAIGTVGPIPESVFDIIEEYDCNHIFLSGKKRSPVGKAIFGDIAQQILLEFDGPVTITTDGD